MILFVSGLMTIVASRPTGIAWDAFPAARQRRLDADDHTILRMFGLAACAFLARGSRRSWSRCGSRRSWQALQLFGGRRRLLEGGRQLRCVRLVEEDLDVTVIS